MKKLHNTQGFTVLELVLFILIVGFVVATAFSRVDHEKQNTRNKEREGDVKTVQLAVEAYYAKNGSYPKSADLTNVTWVTTNLRGIDNSLLTDPNGVIVNQAGGYQYAPTKDGKDACTDEKVTCGKYTLTTLLEGKPQLELKSFN